jgi:hypothetical protein
MEDIKIFKSWKIKILHMSIVGKWNCCHAHLFVVTKCFHRCYAKQAQQKDFIFVVHDMIVGLKGQ